MLEVAIVETQRQHVGVGVTKSLNASITTTGVKMVITSNIDVVKTGILIRSIAKLGSGSDKSRQEGI